MKSGRSREQVNGPVGHSSERWRYNLLATAVDVAKIISKMSEDFKTVVLERKVAGGGEDVLGRYVFFIGYFVACISMNYLI